MDIVYDITFIPTPGSFGTLIEYRESTSSVWITPTDPDNPTTLSTYPITLDNSLTYYIRLSSVGINCTTKYKLFTLPSELTTIYYGWLIDPSILVDDASIISNAMGSVSSGHNSTITIDYTSNTSPLYLWMAQPLGEIAKTHWYVTDTNQGNIGDADLDLFTSDTVDSYSLYTTVYQTQQTINPLQFIA